MPSDSILMLTSSQPAGRAVSGGGLIQIAPAKLNLNLFVGPVRSDGFHPLDSIVSKITLCDTLRFHSISRDEVELTCEVDVGPAEDNLAVRAAGLLKQTYHISAGVHIELVKRIPAGGGMGGASSDAAAVLRGLNELWKLNLSLSKLSELGATLGSDVPLFLAGAASRMTGRGETLEPVIMHEFFAVLFFTGLHCSTPAVYRAFDEAPESMGVQPSLDIWRRPPSQWASGLKNQLQTAAFAVSPELKAIFESLHRLTPVFWRMTGSGSGLFALADTLEAAKEIARKISTELTGQVVVVKNNPW